MSLKIFVTATLRYVCHQGNGKEISLCVGNNDRPIRRRDKFIRQVPINFQISVGNGGEVKPSVPCRRFTACKKPYTAWVRCFVGQISCILFLTRDILLLRYQMALVVESGRFEKVLWQQVSHLLLKYTKIRLWNRINGGLCPSGL
jgi:hypothetical protein